RLREPVDQRGQLLFLRARLAQDALELLGDRVHEEGDRVLLIATMRARQAEREVALTEPQEPVDERRWQLELGHSRVRWLRAQARASSSEPNSLVGTRGRDSPMKMEPTARPKTVPPTS